jgi:hypothetical protein
VAASVGGVNDRNNRVGCGAENDLHADGQRSEDVLLRKAKEWKVAVQTHGQNARQMLLHGNVSEESSTCRRFFSLLGSSSPLSRDICDDQKRIGRSRSRNFLTTKSSSLRQGYGLAGLRPATLMKAIASGTLAPL